MRTAELLDLIDTQRIEGGSTLAVPTDSSSNDDERYFAHSIFQYVHWYYDGEESEFDKPIK